MAGDYVETRIREALKACGGDRHDAQKLLITWAVRDPSLLFGLTKPHLKAIAAAWIERGIHPARKDESSTEAARLTRQDLEAALAAPPQGEKRSPILPEPKTSSRQASVMQQLAAAFKKKK